MGAALRVVIGVRDDKAVRQLDVGTKMKVAQHKVTQ